ncbi:TIGR04141 family sporadically distributed protein [Kutzneria sp. CA-103260]|uniref:TIGR04141 family sporadically distributed protein n=1 Tax=Kutzneria sp. CA-103260 TaxID=2802641 RepID=UPI001BA49282|nr:TIGR04141 family sporadically distributed protein [Kutzneria sp. CA-103260]QUQ62651.1 hypothetical protein JJ691_03630 [Kutzneria sp. CA-103260]
MAARRSPCKPTSLYRLEGPTVLADCLRSLSGAEVAIDTNLMVSEVNCRLVTGLLRSDKPSWADQLKAITEVEPNLQGNYPFAVLLVPISPWVYALTWGGGHHFLDDELVEQGFGLSFGIRRLDAAKLGLIASSALDASARSTQTSYPGGSDLAGFRLEPFGELVNRMAGEADMSGLTYGREVGKPYRIKVGNALWAPLGLEPAKLIADLRAIGEVVDQSDEFSALRFVAQTRPVPKHHSRQPELRRRLAAALGGDVGCGVLGLAWPNDAVNDAEAAGSFRVSVPGAGGPLVVDTNLQLQDIVDQFAGVDADDRVETLRRAKIAPCEDDAGEDVIGRMISAAKWLTFETTIDHTRYCFHQGKWHRIGENFVQQIRQQVDDLLTRRASLTLPTWVPSGKTDDEHRYCQLVAKRPGYLCLDKNFASTSFHRRFELCDLVGPDGQLIHVKWLGQATAASHLFVQAQVSADALREEPEALRQLDDKVRAIAPMRGFAEVPDKVVLAIAGRPWSVDRLFTLSQLALLRLDRTLHSQRIALQFAEVPFVTKPARRRNVA